MRQDASVKREQVLPGSRRSKKRILAESAPSEVATRRGGQQSEACRDPKGCVQGVEPPKKKPAEVNDLQASSIDLRRYPASQ